MSSLVICRRLRKSKMTLKISVSEDWLYQGSENMITSKFWTMWLFSGRLFGATGEQPFIGSTLSSAFPLVNHPAFGAIYSAGASRPEFGGLGSLGMSAALAAHPQLGALSGKTEICCFASSWFPLSSPPSSLFLYLAQNGGELLKPMDEVLLPFSPPSLASLPSSLIFSLTTAPALFKSGCRAKITMPRRKVRLQFVFCYPLLLILCLTSIVE